MRNVRQFLGLIVAGCVAFGLLQAPALAIEMTPELRKVVDGARTEGRLVIETPPGLIGGGHAAVKEATAWIKRELGVTLDTGYKAVVDNRGQPVQLLAELQANVKASTDIFLAAATSIDAVLDKNLFRAVPWSKLMPGRITDQIAEADGRALRILTRFPGILYNKKLIPQMGNVQSMYDLLKPEFKGKFSTTPFLGGFDGFIARIGYEKSATYFEQFSEQISGLIPCSSGERIASGEVLALVLDCAGTEQNQERFKNQLALRIVPDAPLRRYQYLAIPTNAANPNAAILFGLWFSSVEGQEWQRKHANNGDLDIYPESMYRPIVKAYEEAGIKFTDIDLEWAAQHPEMEKEIFALIKMIRRK